MMTKNVVTVRYLCIELRIHPYNEYKVTAEVNYDNKLESLVHTYIRTYIHTLSRNLIHT